MTTQEVVTELAKQVIDELSIRQLTLAVAESCTGGLASSFLTDIDGSSEVLLYSIVTYSLDSKEEFLGIPPYVIRDFGSVSLECVKLMAEGALEYDADIGIATTGVIGESIENKLKGTAFIAIAISGYQTFTKELALNPKKTRFELKLEIIHNLFESLLEAIDLTF